MTDHLISYLKCVSLPSENIKSQRKKNFDSLLKICKKSKRDFTNKLNKNQIDKFQVISYYESKRNQLNKIKKDRLEKIILLTQEFINNISDDESENVSDSINDSKKRHIEEYDNGKSKKQKLISVEEEVSKTAAPRDNNIYVDNLVNVEADVFMDIEMSPNKFPSNINTDIVNTVDEIEEDNQFDKLPAVIFEKKDNATVSLSSQNSSDKPNDKTFDLSKSNEPKKYVYAKTSEKSNSKPMIKNVSSSMKHPIPVVPNKPVGPTPVRAHVKNFELKTPQQVIYKGKHQPSGQTNSLLNSKTNSLSKSQTLSSQKKPVAEIRKQQDKLEEEKKRKLEEKEAKRKENLMKLDEIKNSKKLQALAKPTNNSSSAKPAAVAPVLKPAHTAGNIAVKPGNTNAPAVAKTANVPTAVAKKPAAAIPVAAQPQPQPQPQQHPNPTSSKVCPPKTVSQENTRFNPIEKFPIASFNPLVSSSALKPVNAELASRRLPESVGEESHSLLSTSTLPTTNALKTPFVKKRTTLLSDSCKKIINNHESYFLGDLIDLDSDEEEEENQPSHRIPRWCQKDNGTLINLIKYQSKHYSPSNVFLEACYVRIDYKEIFGHDVEIKKGCLEPWN